MCRLCASACVDRLPQSGLITVRTPGGRVAAVPAQPCLWHRAGRDTSLFVYALSLVLPQADQLVGKAVRDADHDLL